HAAARSTVSHGSCTASIAAVSIATLCHVPLSGLLTLLVCSIFCHRVLADYGPHIAAARPLICHGPLYRLLMLLPGPESLMGPCTDISHCCCLIASLLCHVPLSGLLTTLLVCSFFVIFRFAGRLQASHRCRQAPNLPWAPVP
ncbi:unnamed protein product, partial [Staurois parvus]